MATQEPKTVAFVLYPGITLLDMVGPLQVFSVLQGFNDQYRPVVVAERIEPMPTDTPSHGHRGQDLRRGTPPGRGAGTRWRRPAYQGHVGSGDRLLPASGRRDLRAGWICMRRGHDL